MDPVTGVVEAPVQVSEQPASTLANLKANIAAEITAQQDVNAGVPVEGTTPASGDPAAAPVTPVEGEVPAEADQGKMSRISQRFAQMRTTLTKLGIDPDGDTIEAINSGLVTANEVFAAQQPITPAITPQASTPAAPELSLSEQVNNLQSVLNAPIPKDGFTSEDVVDRQKAFMGVIAAQAKEISNITTKQEQREAVVEANDSRVAISNVFDEQIAPTLPAGLPEETKQTLSAIFIASTNLANGELVETHGKAKAQSPNGYAYTANKIASEFNGALKGIFNAGVASTGAAPAVPAVPNAGVHQIPNAPTVLRPGVGGGPPAPANNTKFTLENLPGNVDNYMNAQQPQV